MLLFMGLFVVITAGFGIKTGLFAVDSIDDDDDDDDGWFIIFVDALWLVIGVWFLIVLIAMLLV